MFNAITGERLLIALLETIGVEVVILIIGKCLQRLGEISDVIIVGSILGVIPSIILGAMYNFKTIIITMIVCIVIMGIIAGNDDTVKKSDSDNSTILEELGVILGLHMIEKSYKKNERDNNKKDKK